MTSEKPSSEFARWKRALGYSRAGLKDACGHAAFRTELMAAAVMVPLGIILGGSGAEQALLIGSVLLVLTVELLNTGIEAAIDRISTELHPLSKRAKDMGSAAVLISLINAGLIWLLIVW